MPPATDDEPLSMTQSVPSTVQSHLRFRLFKDKATTTIVSIGGLSVLGTLMLIFVYLLYEVVPLFESASMELKTQYQLDIDPADQVVYLALEEQNEVALRVMRSGRVAFWNAQSGEPLSSQQLPIDPQARITSFREMTPGSPYFVVGLSNGKALIGEQHFRTTYPDDKRKITPSIRFPEGKKPVAVSSEALVDIAFNNSSSGMTLAAVDASGALRVLRFTKEEDFLTGEVVLESEALDVETPSLAPQAMLVDSDQRWLYILRADGDLAVIDLRQQPLRIKALHQPESGASFRQMDFLLGGLSLLLIDDNGELSQWFMVRDEDGEQQLTQIRSFETTLGEHSHLLAEQRRKGFIAYDQNGDVGVYHSTAHRRLMEKNIFADDPSPQHSLLTAALSPRSNTLLTLDDRNTVSVWDLHNEHPEVSWKALWSKVWYESYPKPDFIWQSSSASNDFEPKFSLTPLTFGTLKAAFYTMLLAAPLAICGAIYTAFFMAPAMRRKIKPLIELMEALPTVILGFLAGIWLAPFIENTLPAVFALFIVIPATIILFSLAWYLAAKRFSILFSYIPPGWEAAVLIPVILLAGGLTIHYSGYMEVWLFHGDMRSWVTNELGLSFDQRNTLVVGVAMGIAVIPTIFSITEDAIFSVPKHLSNGSLALGASPWQTLIGVVLPTASPGIFSATMIGMGRAVGETMIVLMATGNTPIMDANILEGLRSLSANIAVEVPEAEVDSTHYRVLYLSAFFLFMFTFVINAAAEWIRQNLRKRYGSL